VSFSIDTSPVIVALAILTLLLAATRTAVTFHQVQALSTVRRQALTDDLTGLGNRRSLFEGSEDQLQTVRPGERIVLLLLDLDNFKLVNDTLGHQCGDELLREAARRLARDVTRPDLVIRLGGDEFALLVGLGAGVEARRIAERVLDLLARPIVVAGVEIRMQASAGIAESDGSCVTIVELLRRADVAMYAAKAVGTRLEAYDASLDEANHARLETVGELRAAFLDGQFVLHYQPKIAIDSKTTFGAEALVRWQHPTRGLLYPDAFLEIVEQSGSMGRLTQIVLELAVGQLARWHTAGIPIRVAVNLSASDLLDEELPERIRRLLSHHSVPVNALELEITESVLMTDPDRACELLNELHGLGLRISVDDYGTGYCSLAYLRDLPIDELKIDRSFIAALAQDPRSRAIVSSTIELAHALHFSVVAEGVEDASTLEVLEACGCDSVQGFYFSRPLPAEEFAVWARSHARDPAAPREGGGWPAVSAAA
jgi:diguanylate cyclase (GGDEF)-like protein